MANGPITVTDTTKNQGAVSVQGSVTGFYLSTNSAYDATDVFLGSRVVPSLGPSVTDVGSTQLIIPPGTATGSYNVIAVADMNNAVAESVENNNIRASGDLRVGPDLIVYSLTVHAAGVAGSNITVTENTQNQGGAPAPASVTYYYLSTNSTLDAADLLLATRPISLLGAGQSDTATVSLAIPAATTAGNYYVIARSDGNNAIVESLENNNNRARYFTVTAAPPP
jgi:subtilase family serine protease